MHAPLRLLGNRIGRVALVLAVTLVLLWPIFQPGALLTLDYVASPLQSVQLFGLSINAVIWEKLLLFCIVGGAFSALQILLKKQRWEAFAAAMLFWLVVPFTAERFSLGQWHLLLGTTGVLWITAGIQAWLLQRHWLGGGIIIASLFVLAWLYPRAASFVQILVVAGIMSWVFAGRWKNYWYRIGVGVFAIMLVIALFAGILPHFVDARADIATPEQLAFFSIGEGSLLQRLWGAVNYIGFWAERTGQLPVGVLGGWAWYLPAFLLLPATILGWRQIVRSQAWFGWFLILIYGLALLVVCSNAAGANPEQLFNWYEKLGLIGLRETGKFMALMLVAQLIGFGWGIDCLLRRSQAGVIQFTLYAAFLVPLFAWMPSASALIRPAITPVQYPPELLAVAEAANFKGIRAIIFPWHRYQPYSFTHGRTVDQLGLVLFDRTPFNEASEINSVRTTSMDPWQRRMVEITDQEELNDIQLFALLREKDIREVVVMKTTDYAKYITWAERIGLPCKLETEVLAVFELSGV